MIVNQQSAAQKKVDELYACLGRRRGASPYGSCPVDLTAAFVMLCQSQSCGKCVPCRVGLDRLRALIEKVLDKRGAMEDLKAIERCARAVYDSADCAIGFEAAGLVIDGMAAFRDDYISHVEKGVCTEHFAGVPCVAGCPANVDVPGYIALIREGRYADAVRLIRKDNPFPGVCGLICEHPCEKHCRRQIVDDSVNIRGLKRYAAERAGDVPAPECAPFNGKTVAVIGGGPSGLTAAYFLRLKGYRVTVFEARKKLGGMFRYGIPCYRLPDKYLDRDIDVILSTGIEVKSEVSIGKDITFDEIRDKFDSVYISIGAQFVNPINIPGQDAKGVLSAFELLGAVGEGEAPDFTGKNIVVVGGGNVAMDATRTAKRLGAKNVTCVYRRRIKDMTAQSDEIAGAVAEDCKILSMMAPIRINTENDKVVGLTVQPQLIGPIENGRPRPIPAAQPETVLPCDVIITAIGQAIDSAHFADSGVETKRRRIVADASGSVPGMPGVFTGGDCYSGPATVIRAVDSGKVAASNIDAFFGFRTPISAGVDMPAAHSQGKPAWGRVNMRERNADERREDFNLMETCLSDEEAHQECSRCLRCDHYGYGAFRGGRKDQW
jgi:NADPH-dependent glutamate synthase beta subunit-like oxidoreductase